MLFEVIMVFLRKFSPFRVALWSFALVMVVGCANEKDSQKKLPGERFSAIESDIVLRRDADADNISIRLPDAVPNLIWPQQGYDAAHEGVHAKVTGLNEIAWSLSIGSGQTGTRVFNAGPVAAEGIIYVLDTTGLVSAIDAKKGILVWEKRFSGDITTSGGGLAYGDGYIYVALPNGLMAKLNAVTGISSWEATLPFGVRSAPTLFKEKLFFVTSNNETMALATETGEVIWKHQAMDHSLSLSGGAAPAVSDAVVIAPYATGEVHALYPKNGYSLWKDTLASITGLDSKSMIGQLKALPVLMNGVVYVLSHGHTFVAYDLRTGLRIWEKPFGSLHTCEFCGTSYNITRDDLEQNNHRE